MIYGELGEPAETTFLLRRRTGKLVPRVRIPHSPPRLGLSMIKIFEPTAPEVREFREAIYIDLGLSKEDVRTFDIANPISNDQLAYWYSDQKFLTNGFDQVLIYYCEGQPAGLCCGTHLSKSMYRGIQMYYILKKFRGKKDCNSLPGRPGGMMHYQLQRARDLGCKIFFIAVHTYDRRHQRYWEGLKRDTFLGGIMNPKDRQYSARDFVPCEKTYMLQYVPQHIGYINLTDDEIDFDEIWNKEISK